MSSNQTGSGPSQCSVLRTLRDGFWDRTEVIELRDGSLRVRKASKADPSAGPWGAATLRREIQYLQTLDGRAAKYFPQLLAAWDDGSRLGYEMSHLENTVDVGSLARSGRMTQQQADAFQDKLAQVVFGLVHRAVGRTEPLVEHVPKTISGVLDRLAADGEFARLIDAPTIRLNGERMAGPRAALRRLAQRPGAMETLDQPPCVRLHGDLFLENVLLPRRAADAAWPTELTLLDPVSVAGVRQGHPLFDLVKYESYATGELPALRSEKVDVEGFGRPRRGRYVYRVRWEDPVIQPFRQIDWHSRFRTAHVRRYGPIDPAAYSLLEAYFALVMAACTKGLQRRARLLKGTSALNAALAD